VFGGVIGGYGFAGFCDNDCEFDFVVYGLGEFWPGDGGVGSGDAGRGHDERSWCSGIGGGV